jgi:mono/diheme cytochrome c family protein
MRQVWILLLIILLLTGCSAGGAAQEQESPTEKLYNTRCAGCHGFEGEPAKANLPNIPNFTDPEFHKKHTDKQLQVSIEEGIRPLMPSFKDKLEEDEIKSLVAYVRSLAKKKGHK